MFFPKITILFMFFVIMGPSGLGAAEPAESQREISIPYDSPIERGRPSLVIDSVGNAFSLPQKVVLLNPKIDNHNISPGTEEYVRVYLRKHPELKDLKVRMNQWDPAGELSRLTRNDRVSWWWRIFPGIPVTLWASLTGRLLGGDNYNPFTHTVSFYSDSPSVALHEMGHAKDFAGRWKGFDTDVYAMGRIFPPVALYQEYAASSEAIRYLKDKGDYAAEQESYRTLYPAFGTYGGEYTGVPYGNVAGAAVGHGIGFWKFKERELYKNCVRLLDEEADLQKDPLLKELSRVEYERGKMLHHDMMAAPQISEEDLRRAGSP